MRSFIENIVNVIYKRISYSVEYGTLYSIINKTTDIKNNTYVKVFFSNATYCSLALFCLYVSGFTGLLATKLKVNINSNCTH